MVSKDSSQLFMVGRERGNEFDRITGWRLKSFIQKGVPRAGQGSIESFS